MMSKRSVWWRRHTRRPPAQCGALRRKTAQKHSPRNEAELASGVFAAVRPGPGHRQAVAGPPPALISHEKLQKATKTAVVYESRQGCFGLGCSLLSCAHRDRKPLSHAATKPRSEWRTAAN